MFFSLLYLLLNRVTVVIAFSINILVFVVATVAVLIFHT